MNIQAAKQLSYYPVVDINIDTKDTHTDVRLLSRVRKMVEQEYIEAVAMKALRFSVDKKWSEDKIIMHVADFVNRFHFDVAILLETNKFDINEAIDVNGTKYKLFDVSDFQMPQTEYVNYLSNENK